MSERNKNKKISKVSDGPMRKRLLVLFTVCIIISPTLVLGSLSSFNYSIPENRFIYHDAADDEGFNIANVNHLFFDGAILVLSDSNNGIIWSLDYGNWSHVTPIQVSSNIIQTVKDFEGNFYSVTTDGLLLKFNANGSPLLNVSLPLLEKYSSPSRIHLAVDNRVEPSVLLTKFVREVNDTVMAAVFAVNSTNLSFITPLDRPMLATKSAEMQFHYHNGTPRSTTYVANHTTGNGHHIVVEFGPLTNGAYGIVTEKNYGSKQTYCSLNGISWLEFNKGIWCATTEWNYLLNPSLEEYGVFQQLNEEHSLSGATSLVFNELDNLVTAVFKDNGLLFQVEFFGLKASTEETDSMFNLFLVLLTDPMGFLLIVFSTAIVGLFLFFKGFRKKGR